MLRNIRAVLLDAVGTLIYPDPPVAQAYHQHGLRFGSSLTEEQIARRFKAAYAKQELADSVESSAGVGNLSRRPTNQQRERQRWQTIVADVFHDVDGAAGPLFESLWNHFADSRNWSLYADVLPTLRDLQDRDVTIGIASNFDDRLRNICRGLEPLACCRHLFISATIGFPKPSSEFFRAVEQELELTPTQILLVGDDFTNDYLGGKAAGWQMILLDRAGRYGAAGKASLTQIVQ